MREPTVKSATPKSQYHLGMAYYMLGEEAPARLALQSAAASLVTFPGQVEARQRLATLSIDPKSADQKTIDSLEKNRPARRPRPHRRLPPGPDRRP